MLQDTSIAERIRGAARPGVGACRTVPECPAVHAHRRAGARSFGVGGAGGNAVNRMIGAGLRGVHFIAANTDIQALNQSLAPVRIQIGAGATRGLGSGGDPGQGRRAAEEDEQVLSDSLGDSDMVFITAGMGGISDSRGSLRPKPVATIAPAWLEAMR